MSPRHIVVQVNRDAHRLVDSWSQHVDDLLEDMGLPVMRSGGNVLTWPFKVVELSEIQNLKEERDARRARKST